ncbi:hypothetical protein G7062_02050 [Erysipelothrix sp. HDW6C]|uniref:hypothetical protein n=1 Tax=Erysipelothrix sp. HDW6C TaxID=2714930 RepID=UPI00140A6DBC|nr:hypothetical protein [Erysipelothrix sp. HDW6C]QIK69138.1 hypothetical protein G7062_02050 [Erysipelothrix sp. HDW6C]
MRKIFSLVLLVLLIVGCSTQTDNRADMKDYENLSKKHHYIDSDYVESTLKLKNLEQGYYTFGFTDSMSSQLLIEAFEEVMSDKDITSYYYDLKSDDFSTLVHRRLDEFFVHLSPNQLSGDRWPAIIVVNENGDVKVFNSINTEDVERIKEDIVTALFE